MNEVVSNSIRHCTSHYVKLTKTYPNRGLYRPLGLLELVAPRISIQSAHEGGKVDSPTHRPPLPLSPPQGHSEAEGLSQ